MMRHLRYRTIRKKLYEDIFNNQNEEKSTSKLLEPNKSRKSIFDAISKEVASLTPGTKQNKLRYDKRALSDIKNFLRIFTGYNINNYAPSQNLVKDLAAKNLNRQKSEVFMGKNIVSEADSKPVIEKRKLIKKRLLIPKNSHPEIIVNKLNSMKSTRLHSVRFENRKQIRERVTGSSSILRRSTNYTHSNENINSSLKSFKNSNVPKISRKLSKFSLMAKIRPHHKMTKCGMFKMSKGKLRQVNSWVRDQEL